MTRGRTPLPTNVKLLRGTKKSRINMKEPKLDRALPKPPRHLSKGARAEWNRIAPILCDAGLLTKLDVGALEIYCVNYAVMVDAEKELAKSKLVITETGSKGQRIKKVNPWFNVLQSASKMVLELAREFGCTPATRHRVSAIPTPELDPFAEFESPTLAEWRAKLNQANRKKQ